MLITFETDRLSVDRALRSPTLIAATRQIATPAVTRNLPPDLVVTGTVNAEAWLSRLMAGSSVMTIEDAKDVIGFLTLFETADGDLMLGYLLAETVWGKGIATELVRGLVQALRARSWHGQVLGGVDPANAASAAVLKKAGFKPAGSLPTGTDLFAIDL